MTLYSSGNNHTSINDQMMIRTYRPKKNEQKIMLNILADPNNGNGCYKPIKINEISECINDICFKNLSIEEYLAKIEEYLKDIVTNFKP